MADGDLQSVGEALRAAREAQGFSLQEVEAQTRIRLKFLRALEEGDVDVLPSALHAKGFLRNYALFLRLDADDLVDRFNAATGHTPRPVTRLTETPAPYPPPGTRATPPFAAGEGEVPPVEASDSGEPADDVPVDDLPPEADAEAAGGEGAMPEADAAEDVGEEVEAEAEAEADGEAEPEEEPFEAELPPLAPPPPPRLAQSTFIPTSQRVGPGVPRGLVGQPAPVPVLPDEMDTPPPEESPTRGRPQRSPAARAVRSNIFAAAVLVVAFSAIIWFVTSRLSQISGEALISATQVPVEALINTPEGETTPGADAEIAVDGESGENGEPTPFPTAATGADAGESIEAASVAGRVVLSIDVVQQSWVRVEVDGETAFEGQAKVGEVLLYEGEDTVLIRAGNGAGLEATVNGQAIGPLGERGEVVERMFTPDGEIEPPAGSGGGVGPGDDAELTTTPGGEPTSTPTPPPTPEP